MEEFGSEIPETGHSSTRDATGSRGSGSDPGPAETLTRDQHAGEMHDASSVEQDDEIPDDDEAAATLDAGADTETPDAQDLAEPRSRQEAGDEARAEDSGEAAAHPLPQDGRRTLADEHDGPYRRFTVVQADRTLGDTTPTGIGLKPTGEELLDMESDKLSRGERFRKNFYKQADDIQDATEKNASELQALLGAHPPAGHAETATAHPAMEHPQLPPADAGNIATAALVVGLLADRAIHWGRQRLSDRRD